MTISKSAFSCQQGSWTVRGFEFKTQQHNGTPIIMSHAFLSNQKIMQKYAEALAKEGYIVFTYDFCGGAILGKSDGKFSDMSIDTEKDDLKAVIAYADSRPYADMSRLVLLGASQGGFVSCLVAAEYQKQVSKLVLFYPALCIPDNARDGKMLMMTFNPGDIKGTLKSRPFKFSAKYPESAIDIDIYGEIQKIQAPMLVIHGTADQIVDVQYAKKAVAVSQCESSRLVILEGAGHGFKKEQVKTALDHVIEFLKS